MHVETSDNLARGSRMLLVVALHIVAIYAIATSLGVVRAPQIVKPMEAMIIDAAKPEHMEKPVLAKPQLDQPNLDVQLPDTPPEVDVPVDTTIAPPDAAPTDAISDANLQVTRRVEPNYPPASRRAGEQGIVVFNVLVDPSGHPQEVKVQTSSGYDRLDQAAMDAIRHWTFTPAVRDSQKVAAWTRVRVKFQLQTAQG
jgi:periplasmic protein TonB